MWERIEWGGFIIVVVLCLFAMMFTLESSNRSYSKAYKQGQIDAINGIIKYELVENKDHTTEWKIIVEGDNSGGR